MILATCHPERQRHSVNGLCHSCHNRHRWQTEPTYRAKKLESARLWRANRIGKPHWNRIRKLRAKYGITLADYDAMYVAQSGKCAICTDWHAKLHIDHDHITNRVRQLLCQLCNRGIGHFKEDPARLLAAADYVKKHLT